MCCACCHTCFYGCIESVVFAVFFVAYHLTAHWRSLPLDREVFREVTRSFCDLLRFSRVFGSVWTCSDALGHVRMHSDTCGCFRRRLDTSVNFVIVRMILVIFNYRRSRLLFSSLRKHILEIFGAMGAHVSSLASPVFGTSAQNIEEIRKTPKASGLSLIHI